MSSPVFLSYGTSDEPFVRNLAYNLREVGLEPWHYTAAERFGDDYTARLISAIEQALAVVVIVSANSANSLPVLQEILHARLHRKRIIPVELEPCDGPVPYHLSPYYRITCWDRHNIAPEILLAVQDQDAIPDDLLRDYASLQVLPNFVAQASRVSIVLEVPNDFMTHALPAERGLCVIGRDPRHTLSFRPEFVSRTHARISLRVAAEGVNFVLVDLKSTRGTFVNGQAMTAPYLLNDGDQIGLGTPAAMLLYSRLLPTALSGRTEVLPDRD